MERLNRSVSLDDKTIRVTVPATAMYDLDQMQKIQREVLGRLGCPACCSGFDIRFDLARRFMVDEDLVVRPMDELA